MALFVVRTSCFAPSSTLLHVPVEFAQRKFLRHFSPVSGCLSKLNVLTSRPHILLLLCFRLTPSEQGSNCRSSPHTYAFALLAKFALRTRARLTQVRYPHLARAPRSCMFLWNLRNANSYVTLVRTSCFAPSQVWLGSNFERYGIRTWQELHAPACVLHTPMPFSFSLSPVGLLLKLRKVRYPLCPPVLNGLPSRAPHTNAFLVFAKSSRTITQTSKGKQI